MYAVLETKQREMKWRQYLEDAHGALHCTTAHVGGFSEGSQWKGQLTCMFSHFLVNVSVKQVKLNIVLSMVTITKSIKLIPTWAECPVVNSNGSVVLWTTATVSLIESELQWQMENFVKTANDECFKPWAAKKCMPTTSTARHGFWRPVSYHLKKNVAWCWL